MEELHRQFEHLRHEDLSVSRYEMRFLELAPHAVWLVPIEREKINRFINGLNQQFRFVMTLENIAGAKFDEVVDSARRLEMPYHNMGHPYRPAQMARSAQRGASDSYGSYNTRSGQSSFSALPVQSLQHASSAQVSTGSATGYQEHQLRQRRGCFDYGDLGHIKRDCPRLLSGTPQQSSRLMVPAPTVIPPTQLARGRA
ncbi:uncharacterized protein [Nicotiana tomentosiformis]|uniref:uncharacterized protein n=1 Tax=Nicotiana tomentosiformis TaxID=4098 RepID=UPI00388C8AD8